jgi:photosystem II stability/assembly factor-like uncharacterized protein
MRQVCAVAVVLALASSAAANGRDPFISSLEWRAGDPSHVIAGATFGLLRSDDGGATWRWYCESAVGYGGDYDPDYAYSSSGAVFATTASGSVGLRVMRDDCSFASTALGDTVVQQVELGPDGALYIAASAPNDIRVYRSSDDGVTFPQAAEPGPATTTWRALVVAPSDPARVYASGEYIPGSGRALLAVRSDDGGVTYAPMSLTGIAPTSLVSTIEIAGVDANNADIVFARISNETEQGGESIYRSIDGGGTWMKLVSAPVDTVEDRLSFVARADGSCVAGTRDIGAWASPACDPGTWVALQGAPHIGCLRESPAGEVWACTRNTANPRLGLTGDGYGIMKSADLVTWTPVLRFEDIAAPVSCPAGTAQADQCVQTAWCCTVAQLGITSTEVSCSGALACGTRDVAAPPARTGCCDAGETPPLGIAGILVTLLLRRRSRQQR